MLQQAAGEDAALPNTLVLDHPTSRSLAAFLRDVAPARVAAVSSTDATVRARPPSASVGLEAVLEMACRTAGAPLDADTPLMDAGLDSLGAVELQNMLQQAAGEDAALPNTLVLDHPTSRSLAAFLEPEHAAEQVPPSGVALVGATGAAASEALPLELPLDLASLSTDLGGAFEAFEDHPSLVRLRAAKTERGSAVDLVIMHSFLGDESGYERLWKLHLPDRAIFAIRHPYLTHSHTEEDSLTAASMLAAYAAALVAEFGQRPFDLIGASYGSLVTHHLAHAARAAGACPRKLVLVDPFPAWPRIRETAPNSTLLSSRENDPRSAAHFILKLRLHAQLGAEDGEETLARLEDELAEVPGDAVHLFLAAQAMPGAPPRELLVQALREHRRIMAVSSISPTILDLVETMAPFASSGDGPAILMVLSSERMVFYEGVYGQEGLEDQLDLYGPTLEPIRVEGEHFDVVTRCISNRVPEFTSAVEHFLSAQGEAEYSSDA